MEHGCSTCGAPNAELSCNVCGDYQFCSHACSDAVATKHQATCYDKCCADSVEAVVKALGLVYVDHEQGLSAIEAYLDEHGTLTPAAIAASSTRHRKKRLASHEKHIRVNKGRAAHHRKEAAKHQAVLDDKNASAAQKKEAKKQLAFHNKQAAHHDSRVSAHKDLAAKRKAQLGIVKQSKPQPPPPPPRDDETLAERHEREKRELDRRHAAERESLSL
jgi:hypothetical protein